MTKITLLSVWIWLAAGVVHAQDPQAEYQNLVEKGLQEFELGNYSEARVFFQRAHQLAPSARTLRSLGMTSYEIRHYVEAQDYFQQALASDVRPLTPQLRDEVTQLFRQARSFITRLQLTVIPADAHVHIDTHEVTRDADGTILLDPGAHELTVDAAHYDPITRTLQCESSETIALSIQLRETALPAADTPTSHVAPYLVLVGSAAVAVAGGALLTIALSNKHAVENPESTAGGPRYADYEAKASTVTPLSAAGITALCAGGVGFAAGLIWKLTDPPPRSEKSSGTSLSLSPAGISLYGRY
jgi:hypothetical protein